jgi:hypothetical protein
MLTIEDLALLELNKILKKFLINIDMIPNICYSQLLR